MHSPTAFLRPRPDPAAIERLRASAQRVFAPHPAIVAAYLYGSGARGEPLADLDVAVLTERGADALLKSIEEPAPRTVWLLCAPTASIRW